MSAPKSSSDERKTFAAILEWGLHPATGHAAPFRKGRDVRKKSFTAATQAEEEDRREA